jgi:hypothetical protein
MKTEARRAALGQAKLALCLQIPSQASLHGTVKTHRPFCYANGPASPRNLFENTSLRLVSKRGDVVKKHPQARLRVSFHNRSSIRVANQHDDFSVFLFDSFAPAHLIRRFSQPAPPSELPYGSLSRLVPKSRFALRANLRLLYRAPAPVLGCVHPSHPWLKKPPIRVCPCFSCLAQAVKNRKKHQFALGFQAGRCCEKASASPLARVFSTTDPAFA